MTTQESISLIDDVDGGVAERTISFALDGERYIIDLTRTNRNAFIRDIARFMAAARPVDGSRPRMRVTETEADPRTVRAWARANRVPVPEGKRVPRAVIDRFHAAGN